MASSLDEFKEFVKRHPLLKLEVKANNKTWQQIYEDWVILKDDMMWEEYKEKKQEKVVEEAKTGTKTEPKSEEKTDEKKDATANDDIIKNVLGYVKKINPDTITKYVGSIQKIVELIGAFGGGALAKGVSTKKTGDPLFDKRFDEWY